MSPQPVFYYHHLIFLLFRPSIMAPVSPMADLCPLCGVPSFPPALLHNSCAKVVRFPYTAILEAHFNSFLKLLFPHTPICGQDASFYKLTSAKYKIY